MRVKLRMYPTPEHGLFVFLNREESSAAVSHHHVQHQTPPHPFRPHPAHGETHQPILCMHPQLDQRRKPGDMRNLWLQGWQSAAGGWGWRDWNLVYLEKEKEGSPWGILSVAGKILAPVTFDPQCYTHEYVTLPGGGEKKNDFACIIKVMTQLTLK